MKKLFLSLTLFLSLVATGQNNPNFYLHENGVTCMCPNAANGETGTVNGKVYTKRTREELTTENASTTCTSGIMYYIGNTFIKDKGKFNEDISSWDVSNIVNFGSLFHNATSFNQPIGNWNTSNVTHMRDMFYNASSFNQPIGNWDTSKVTDMYQVFRDAKTFNQPIGNWDTSNVTDISWMFFGASVFNQPIGDWNTSNVTVIEYMFTNATAFNQNITGWCVAKISSEPVFFSKSSALTAKNKPKWGSPCQTLSSNDFELINSDIVVSPNPFATDVTINLPENTIVQQAQVVNAVGQTVYTSVETKLNLEHLSTGIYFLKIKTNQGDITKKIIKN